MTGTLKLSRTRCGDQGDRLPIGALLFDLDDTLCDRSDAFQRWATGFVESRLTSSGRTARDAARDWLIEVDEQGYCPRPEFGGRIRERFPVTMPESTPEFVVAFQKRLVSEMTLADGADALLNALVVAAIPWGIVTNGSTAQQTRKIDHLGFSGRTSCVFVSEAFRSKKPDPDIFLAAARDLGVPRDRTLFVGDHPFNDIVGARQADMRTAWIRRGRKWPPDRADARPDLVVNTLGELTAALSLGAIGRRAHGSTPR